MDDGLIPLSNDHQQTLRQTLNKAVEILAAAGVPSPEVDARELVLHALGLPRLALLTRASEMVSAVDAARVRQLVAQRAARIPLQHLLGEVEWGGVRLKTDARALVPRPETEVLLQLALQAVQELISGRGGAGGLPPTLLDIGTGTGALALALKYALPAAQVFATDLSADALALAQENAELNGLDVQFVQGNLFASLPGPFDLLVSNPPYLPAADRKNADPEVRHDPDLALYSGPDGLELARKLVPQARHVLKPGGVLLLELDPRNVRQLAAEMTADKLSGWNTEVLPDLTGRLRFLRATRVVGG